jgi:WD40 repeat protein
VAAPSETAAAAPDARDKQARARYDAFISYSHHGDARLAPLLQAGLHRFAKPWYRLRAVRVFRDEASLAATPALWESITEALAAAEFFVLLASPAAKASEWVAREAGWWRERKPVDRILLLLTDGELAWDDDANDFDWTRTDALPKTLARCFPEEPRWIDLRWTRDEENLSLRNPRFRDALAEVAAPLHGRPKDELIGEDVLQHRRAVRLARAAVATLVVLLIAAIASAVFALGQRNTARAQRDRAEQQARIATSRLLADQALTDLERSPDRSILLSLEAFRLQPTFEARASLVRALQHTQRAPAVLRPGGEVLSVGFSRDGRTLMTTGDDERVRLWNVAANREEGKPLDCYCLLTKSGALLMPDGKRVVAADGFDSTSITFSSLRTRKALREVTDDAGSIEGLAVSSDGRFLASFGEDRPAVIWDAVKGRPLGRLRGTGTDSVWAVGFSPDGRLAAVDDATRGLELWDVDRRTAVERLARAGNWPRSFAFTRDGKTIAFENDSGIHVRAVGGGPNRGRPIVIGAVVNDIAFDPTGRLLATATEKGVVRIWDAATGRPVGDPLVGHENFVNAVAFSPDGRTLASAGQDGTVRLWTVASAPLGTPVARVSVLAQDPTGRLVADYRGTKPFALVRESDWSVARTLRGDGDTIEAAFGPGGKLVALGDESGAVTVWNTATGRRVGPVLGTRRSGRITSVAISPDGRYVAAIGQNEWLRVWRTGTWKLVGIRSALQDDGPTPGLDVAIFRPDGSLVTAGRTGVALWHIKANRLLKPEVIDVDVSLDDAALSPDGRTLALGTDEDSLVRLLDLRTRKQLEPLAGHSEGVDSLAFSPDGRVLASGSAFDETMRLWDVASGRPLTGALRSDYGAPGTLTFTPSGDALLSSNRALVSWDPILWRGTFAEFRKRLCPVAGRNLRRGEWQRFLPGEPYRITCPDE